MSVSDNKKNCGTHRDSSFMLGRLRPSSENPPDLFVGSVKKCDNCKRYHKSCSGGEEMADYCEKRNLRLPITNKDKLMSGSEEELAWFILHKIHTERGATCPPPFVKGRCPVGVAFGLTCEECWEDWLKEEAEV